MLRIALAFAFLTATAQAQWTILDSHSTANFRGVDSVGKGIVWVSGTEGTVLRSEDAGYLWQHCTVPPGAEHLDFRGIQAFDANTAIVMSSGKGDLSRLYKTTDGCQTWKLVFTNPDKDGFWDALQFVRFPQGMFSGEGYLIGDPFGGMFQIFVTEDAGSSWRPWGKTPKHSCGEHIAKSRNEEALFAASNQAMAVRGPNNFLFVTGGNGGARLVFGNPGHGQEGGPCWTNFSYQPLTIGYKTESSGAFAVASSDWHNEYPEQMVIVGGEYTKPNDTNLNSLYLARRAGFHPFSQPYILTTSTTPPHGYRSAVAYDAASKTWITVGPNGTDISTDDGKNWRALKPGPNDTPDADQHWNALSLPFVVGPHGRIGVLNEQAVKAK